MSKINDLIKELCPDGVEYKKLSEIASFDRGKGFKKDDIGSGEFPIIFYGELYTTYGNYIHDVVSCVDKSKVNKPIIVKCDDLVLPISSTTKEAQIGKVSVIKVNTAILGSDAIVIHHNQCAGYLMQYMNSKLFESKKMRCVSGTTIRHLSPNDLMKISVPIPPLEVQEKIVRILDKFGELEAELEARKSQYEFWRGKLLFNPNYPVYKMEDICIINQGLQIPINQRKKEPGENRYFYITVQFLKNEGENYYIENPSESVICKKDDILVTRTGSTGKIVYGVEGCFHNNFFKVTPTIDLNKRYLYHILNSTQMFNEMLRVASGGTVPDLPHKKFYKLEIGLPEIDEQNRIVNILDKFDALVNDITVGLPAEIELRRKQYEYYRNKLLSFEEVL